MLCSVQPREFAAPIEPWERVAYEVDPEVQRAALRLGASCGCTAWWTTDDWVRPLRWLCAYALGWCIDVTTGEASEAR